MKNEITLIPDFRQSAFALEEKNVFSMQKISSIDRPFGAYGRESIDEIVSRLMEVCRAGNSQPQHAVREEFDEDAEMDVIDGELMVRVERKTVKAEPVKVAKVETIVETGDASAWENVKREDVERIVEGSILAPVVRYLASPANPPLPIEITLPKALSLFGCALTTQKENPEDGSVGISRAKLKINTGNGQAVNMWTCLVAKSGTGKDIGSGDYNLAKWFKWEVGNACLNNQIMIEQDLP